MGITSRMELAMWLLFIGMTLALHNVNCFTRGEDKRYWNNIGNLELTEATRIPWNFNTAKNVILFVAPGMDPNTVTAARIHKYKEGGKLSFESFPNIALLKTYSTNKQVPDTAASATAIFTGVKTNNNVVGYDSGVTPFNYTTGISAGSHLTSIMQWAQEVGKDTGFVTTARVTSPSVSPLYGHSPSKDWECNSKLPERVLSKDLATQLIEDEPGRNLKVIMGGGRQSLLTDILQTQDDPIDLITGCSRTDGKNLVEDWKDDKRQRGASYQYVDDFTHLSSIDSRNTDYLLGIFANSHLPYEHVRKRKHQVPSLELMTEHAIQILKKSWNGFFLVVDSGLIGIGHSEGHAKKAVEETVVLDTAVKKTLQILKQHNILNDTLVVVAGTHGSTMSINGYPDRNNDIFGVAQNSRDDDLPYTSLSYATGKRANYHYEDKGRRKYVTSQQSSEMDYSQQAAILTDEQTSGGGDVVVYATGPMSYLFHSVHEENYVAHAVALAARIGRYRHGINSATSSLPLNTIVILVSAIVSVFSSYLKT